MSAGVNATRTAASGATCDVAVVGGGLVGAALAVALARGGVEVAVIDAADPERRAVAEPDGLGFDLRTVALAPRLIEWLRDLRIWDARCDAAACTYRRMEVWDADGTGRIVFDAEETGVPDLGRIVEQGPLLAACWRALARDPRVACYAPARITALQSAPKRGNGTTLVLDARAPLAAHLVVGADGARSVVRAWAGIDLERWEAEHVALATVARTALPHGACARQRFLSEGPLALLPLADPHHVSVVWSMPPARAAEREGLAPRAFAEALTRASEGVLGTVSEVDRRRVVPLVEQHAARYVTAGVALVGDAAHVIHPLAGQGVNLGLRDAQALAAELLHAGALGCGAEAFADPALLARYERARRGENAAMLHAMRGLRRLFGADRPELRWVRNAGLDWVDVLAPLKRALMRRAMQ